MENEKEKSASHVLEEKNEVHNSPQPLNTPVDVVAAIPLEALPVDNGIEIYGLRDNQKNGSTRFELENFVYPGFN